MSKQIQIQGLKNPRGLRDKILNWYTTRRRPDFIVGGIENPYLIRWWVIPRNSIFNIYLHRIVRDDDDRALHDHPWVNLSILLKGAYDETAPLYQRGYDGSQTCITIRRTAGLLRGFVLRKPSAAHRLSLPKDTGRQEDQVECWTLFITGPRVRTWGFWCHKRWVNWKDFTDTTGEGVGRGCD